MKGTEPRVRQSPGSGSKTSWSHCPPVVTFSATLIKSLVLKFLVMLYRT